LEQYENENGVVQSDMFSSCTHAELKVRKFRGTDDKTSVASLLSDVVMANNAPEMCHVQAQYELGLLALNKARDRGELFTLWQDFFVTSGKTDNSEFPPLQYTFEARKHFQSALNHAGPSATKLTKDILRCLALTTGPEDTDASSFYVNSSIGGSSRAAVLDIFSNQTESNCSTGLQDNIQSLFQMFDDERIDCKERIGSFRNLLNDSVSLLPDGWNLSSLAICPTGEILVSTIRKESTEEGHSTIRTSNVCIMRCNQNRDAHSDLLIPLDQIIDRSQKQLHGMTEEAQTEQYNEESVRRKWWSERHKINDDLRSLLKYAEAEYFGHDLMQDALLPNHTGQQFSSSNDDESSSECSDFGPARLASRFEQVEQEPDTTSLKKLTVAVLKERLTSLGVSTAVFQKMRKAELVELLASEMEKNSEDSIMDDAQETSYDIRHQSLGGSCTILVLDEHLQRFPFESMDMFTSKAVTRVPTLPVIFATLMERKSLDVDPTMISYVLDPESNLSETASTLGPALTSLASSRGWEWDGVIGEMPTPDFMTNILTRDLGMFLYCGHGGGEKFFSRNNVEEVMVSRDDGARGCRPPVVLMGCSSGKLQSVNCPKDNASGQVYSIHYEPEGIALSYLIAGAPCVVGNLWDVTDRDIDRYCLTLMEDFIKEGESMAKCVADARRACKLRYIVGSAPVCYGVPVKCSLTTNSE
jgi:separase